MSRSLAATAGYSCGFDIKTCVSPTFAGRYNLSELIAFAESHGQGGYPFLMWMTLEIGKRARIIAPTEGKHVCSVAGIASQQQKAQWQSGLMR